MSLETEHKNCSDIAALSESLKNDILNLQSQNEALQEQLRQALQKNEWLEEQLKLNQHRQFAKQSETTQTLNLTLFDENESDEVEESIESIDEEYEQVTYSRKKRKGSSRNLDTSQLPRERVVHDLSSEEKICPCGGEMECIGEDRSEKIDYIPAQYKVIEHITPKYSCRTCETIKTAKKPEVPLQKSMATTHFIVDVVLKKYDEHLPLYRQSKILERDGIAIPDNTLGNWVMGAADALIPLGDAFWEQIFVSTYLQADETRVKILEPDKTGYMWVYQGLDKENRFVLFEFNLTRSGAVPEKRLKHFSGLLQTDAYSGYKRIGAREGIIQLGCWDHARRKFTDAIKANGNNKAGVGGDCLKLINKLYKVEKGIKNAVDKIRHEIRQEKSHPILDALFNKVHKVQALPKSTLATAITYLKNQESELREYIEHGRAHMSNCLTENIIRPFAVGRRNWLFVGNEVSANKSALLYSLIQTCKINKVNVRQYLTYVLNQSPAVRRGEIDAATLLPQFINPEILN